MNNDYTHIRVNMATKVLLDKLKVHPRQSYDEVINELVDFVKKRGDADEDPQHQRKNKTREHGSDTLELHKEQVGGELTPPSHSINKEAEK
jgi:hypothetical protein